MPQDPGPGHKNSVVRRHPDALASPRGTEDAGEARLRPGNHVTRRHTPKLFPPEQTRLLLLAAPARGAHAPRRFLRPCAPAAGGLGGPRGASGGARRARAPPPPAPLTCARRLPRGTQRRGGRRISGARVPRAPRGRVAGCSSRLRPGKAPRRAAGERPGAPGGEARAVRGVCLFVPPDPSQSPRTICRAARIWALPNGDKTAA